ncbi:MAG: TVP38/TMEM64 family protein [Polyangiaceae bacterium]|nr:TVP38/TMEM64 family protein [Polyangiaceae bacterium]
MGKTKIAAVLGVAALLVAAWQLGVFERLGAPDELRRTLLELGAWGYLAFVGAYAVLQPFGLPGTVFIWAAPLIWPWPVAFGLSMVGTMAASVVGFSFARFVARDWIAARIPARFRKYDEAVARRGFVTVFVLRLVFWMPPLLHAFFGVSKVGFWVHFWASLAGYVLPLLIVSYFGEAVFDALKGAPVAVWVALGAGVVVSALGVWLYRRRRGRTQRAPAETTEVP